MRVYNCSKRPRLHCSAPGHSALHVFVHRERNLRSHESPRYQGPVVTGELVFERILVFETSEAVTVNVGGLRVWKITVSCSVPPTSEPSVDGKRAPLSVLVI